MDYLPSYHFLAIAGGFVLGLAFWYCSHDRRRVKSKSTSKGILSPPPELPGAWPVIGHLHLLQGKVPVWRTLGAMADKVGPVFMIRLGMHRTLVVSHHELVKECFTTNDQAFATRPTLAAAKILGYDYALFTLAPYGPYWREIRKLCMLEILSTRRLIDLMPVQVSELHEGIKDLYNWVNNNPKKVVVMSEWFEHLTFNIVLRMVAGKRCFNNIVNGSTDDEDEAAKSAIEAIKKLVLLGGVFVPSDVIPFPFLEWLDLQGHLSHMKLVAKEMDAIIENWVEEHKGRPRLSGTSQQLDFIDVLLTKLEDAPLFGYSRDTIIKATVLTMIAAGTDTTSITSTWVLSALLNNRDVMKKAQEEIDMKVGRERWVEQSDIQNLVYLQGVVKETLRVYPGGPLLVPHEAMEDCCVGGYHIPKGTRLIVNAWKLHRDPAVWSNPEDFQPERFLTSHANVGVHGQNFELIPFGSGRRSCPGINMGLQILHLTIARLIQGFEMAAPSNSPIDMSEGAGATMPKATPLEVMLTPRLIAQLYTS